MCFVSSKHGPQTSWSQHIYLCKWLLEKSDDFDADFFGDGCSYPDHPGALLLRTKPLQNPPLEYTFYYGEAGNRRS